MVSSFASHRPLRAGPPPGSVGTRPASAVSDTAVTALLVPSYAMTMSQATKVEQIPAAPALPAPPQTPSPPVIRIGGPGGATTIELPTRPLTARDVQALRQRGSELSRQLSSANNRRNELSNALEDAEGVNRQGIEQRIAQLDQRIMGIEADIAQNGRLLASAPPSSLPVSSETQPQAPFGLSSDQVTGIAIVGTIFVLFPMSIAMARNLWKRGSRQTAAPVSMESTQRMERLEQAVDAIAIEIERISEGQRFVTRLLTEGSAPALSVGQNVAEPARLPDRESLRASRESA